MNDLTLVIDNDVHACSRYSACPDVWKQQDGSKYIPSEAQKWLQDRRQEVIEEFPKPDILILNGDMTDGHQIINLGREVWNTDPNEQIRLAEHQARLWRAKRTMLTYGSRYHVEAGGAYLEQILAQRLKAEKWGYILDETFAGVKCGFSHEISVSKSSWQYRTTPLAQQMVVDRLEAGSDSANLLVFSHAHYFCAAEFSTQLAVITPGWQGQTPYTARKLPRAKPKVGTVVITLPRLTLERKFIWDGPKIPPCLRGQDEVPDPYALDEAKAKRETKAS